MSKKPNIVVAFPRGGIIPAAVLEKSDDVTLRPHEPIEVPKVYGDHLISDRIAYDYAEAEKRKKLEAKSIDARERELANTAADKQALEKLEAENGALSKKLSEFQNHVGTVLRELGLKFDADLEFAINIRQFRDALISARADLDKLGKHQEAARSKVTELETDKVRLSGEIGSLQTDLDDANKALTVERNSVATLTEQLSEATKPPVQQQETLKIDGDGGKSK